MATANGERKYVDPWAERLSAIGGLGSVTILALALAALIYVMWRNIEQTQIQEQVLIEAYRARTATMEKMLTAEKERITIERERLLVERSILEELRKQ